MADADLLDIERRTRAGTNLLCGSDFVRPSKSRRLAVAHALRASLLRGSPIRLVGYWGVGPRSVVGPNEGAALLFLQRLLDELRRACQASVDVEFLITDTHARLNGFIEEDIEAYCASALRTLVDAGVGARVMSEFLRHARHWGLVSPIIADGPIPDVSWQISSGKLRELSRLAGLRAARPDARDAALRYYTANLIEGACVSFEYVGALFLAYAAPGMDFLLPAALPKVHVWSRWSGDSRRPWFLE